MKPPTSETHTLFISDIQMLSLGGSVPFLVVHETTEHLEIGGALELMKYGPRNWQCLELRAPWEIQVAYGLFLLLSRLCDPSSRPSQGPETAHGQSSLLRAGRGGNRQGRAALS